jgi:hypothetical protein
MSLTQQRSLETEQTQGALRALEIAPAAAEVANEEAFAREEDVQRPAKGIASSLAVGAALWAAVAGLLWLSVR